jgi:hypothetical protein
MTALKKTANKDNAWDKKLKRMRWLLSVSQDKR